MRRKPAVVVTGAMLAIVWMGVLLLWNGQHSQSGPSADVAAYNPHYSSGNGPLPVLWDAPAFSFRDQNGNQVSEKSLRGHLWISDFFFTSCTSICPMMTAKMARLQRTITDPDVRFVSFSVDPDHDTPVVLSRYARMWKADETRWKFLSTDRKHLIATAAGMRTFVQPPSQDSPIQHSGLFILTDKDGHVRAVYDSSDDSALRRLVDDVARLAGRSTTEPAREEAARVSTEVDPLPAARDAGATLYAARGCLGCHGETGVAPPLEGCFGREVLLRDGRVVKCDEAYLRESILDPMKKVTAGYAALMPAYRGQFTETELDQLIGYVKSLASVNRVGNQASAKDLQTIDPVCKMPVDPRTTTFRVSFSGKTYLFCSAQCRDRFFKASKHSRR